MAEQDGAQEENLDEKIDEIAEEVQSEEQEEVVKDEEIQEDRPEKNYKAELARKTAELERARAALAESNAVRPAKRDPDDMSTWGDHELKAITSSNDPSVLRYKDQAQDILLERKVEKMYERRSQETKRALSDVKLRTEYPDALDPTSEFALRMEQTMQEYDLQKSPAGRLAAAKIVASEMKKGASNVSAKERTAEAARVARVKGQMIDGDRSKSVQKDNKPKDEQKIREDLGSRDIAAQARAMKDVLNSRGLTVESFFKR